jgi:hypothetical protein
MLHHRTVTHRQKQMTTWHDRLEYLLLNSFFFACAVACCLRIFCLLTALLTFRGASLLVTVVQQSYSGIQLMMECMLDCGCSLIYGSCIIVTEFVAAFGTHEDLTR